MRLSLHQQQPQPQRQHLDEEMLYEKE